MLQKQIHPQQMETVHLSLSTYRIMHVQWIAYTWSPKYSHKKEHFHVHDN